MQHEHQMKQIRKRDLTPHQPTEITGVVKDQNQVKLLMLVMELDKNPLQLFYFVNSGGKVIITLYPVHNYEVITPEF